MAMADIQVLLSLLHALVCAIHFDLFVYNIQLFVPDTYIRSCYRNPKDLNPNPTTELEKIVNDLRIKYRTYVVDLYVEYGMVVLPTHDFGDELGRYAMLVDCNYNEFEVLVERNNGRIYPTTGWHALKDFFNVPVGSWVSMVYVGFGVPIMLLRNLDITTDICNGTRLILTKMRIYILEGRVISGSNIGEKVYIPRLSMTPSDTRIPFKFQRKQFPIFVCFAMTIHKSQGQSLKQVVSHLTSRDGLKILLTDGNGDCIDATSNVIYKEMFQNV
ncbi:transmembrane protein, putative [Medicago truncatula]|uniref:Transmembrane protein, putative n=1 Tax=Medicago truncatula TaxID=3880 RepID=G7LHV6_MEDTR|nr:transmembrane protein, putative [Medicago truncatula]